MKALRLKAVKALPEGQGYFLMATADDRQVLAADKVIVDRQDGICRRKIGVSLMSGCGIKCIYCFTNRFADYRPLTTQEIVEQVDYITARGIHASRSDIQETKISMKQMGDPLLNPDNTLMAIEELNRKYPGLQFVVSTSGPKENAWFYSKLGAQALSGVRIRLQFSCHTTDDDRRNFLSPQRPMMSLKEIAQVVNTWPGDKVTLNFVILDGFAFNPLVLKELFLPEKIFIKLNHLDDNRYIQQRGLSVLPKAQVIGFANTLQQLGIAYAHRNN